MSSNSTLSPKDVIAPLPMEEVADAIRSWVRNGSLPAGKRLPSERALAEKLGVTRAAVRSALLELEEEGWIEGAGGRVRRVCGLEGDVAPGAARLLANTVPFLSGLYHSSTLPSPTMREPGWSHHLDSAIMASCHEAGMDVLLLDQSSFSVEKVRDLGRASPFGLVLPSAPRDAALRNAICRFLVTRDIPAAAYTDTGTWTGCDQVQSDHESGAYDLCRWLIARGCRRLLRIAHGAGEEKRAKGHWLERRNAGTERACREAGLPLPATEEMPGPDGADYAPAPFREGSGILAGQLVPHIQSDEPVDGILCVSDGAVPRTIAALKLLGRKPNVDVQVVGYDNYWKELPSTEWEPTPPIATMDKDLTAIGKTLFELIVARRQGALTGEPVLRRLPPKLVIFSMP